MCTISGVPLFDRSLKTPIEKSREKTMIFRENTHPILILAALALFRQMTWDIWMDPMILSATTKHVFPLWRMFRQTHLSFAAPGKRQSCKLPEHNITNCCETPRRRHHSKCPFHVFNVWSISTQTPVLSDLWFLRGIAMPVNESGVHACLPLPKDSRRTMKALSTASDTGPFLGQQP